jgi:hypothetical protein
MFFREGVVANTWQQLFDDPLVNTFADICSYCGSSNNPTVGQFVDALTTSIMNALAIRGLCGTVRMMVLLLWITYSPYSGNLMLLHQIPPQVMARKLLRVSMLPSKYRRTWVLQYMLVTWKCSQ